MRSLASLLELTMLLANVLFDRKSMRLRPLVRHGISTSSLFVSCSRLIRATPFHTSKLPVTPWLTALCATVEVPSLMQSMYHRNPWVPAHPLGRSEWHSRHAWILYACRCAISDMAPAICCTF